MAIGKVKWFNNAKGYGFILPDDGGEDLFAHYSSIEMDGYKTLKAGQEVQFDVLEGPKGLHATNIRSSDADAQATGGEDSATADADVEKVAEAAVNEETIGEETVGEETVSAEPVQVEAEESPGTSPGTSEVVSVTVSDGADAESDTVEPSTARQSS